MHLRAVYCAPMHGMQKRANAAKHRKYLDLLRSWRWPRGAKLHEQLDCIRAHVRDEPKAAEALDRILGTKNKELSYEHYLLRLVQAVEVGARPDRGVYENRLMANTGKTLKSVKDFPARIERLATEIEQMNANPFFRFMQDDKLPVAMKPAQGFSPGVLNNSRICLACTPDRFSICLFTVKDWTGKYHDPEVAGLLSAAAAALGKDRVYDAYTLAQARLRYRVAAVNNLALGFTGMR